MYYRAVDINNLFEKKKHHYHLATEHAINTRIVPQFNLMPLQLQEIRKVAQNAQKYDKR